MNRIIATTILAAGALLASGCATKKYVRNTAAPIQAKVDRVDEATSRNSQSIEETRGQVRDVDERAQRGISAASERAAGAQGRADDAMTRANQAGETATLAQQASARNAEDLGVLRSVVANLDDYRLQTTANVMFAFNRDKLDAAAKAELDKLAAGIGNTRRFFVAVEGYTDATGSPEYNAALSKRRAEAVVQYLVANQNVPVYRIHTIGLGQQKPADDGKGREARARNRRVEVKIYSAGERGAAAVVESAGVQ